MVESTIVLQRREKVMECLNKSIYKHSDIAQIVGTDLATVKSDIHELRQRVKPWYNYLVRQNGLMEQCYLVREKIDYLLDIFQKQMEIELKKPDSIEIKRETEESWATIKIPNPEKNKMYIVSLARQIESLIKLGLTIDLKGPILTSIQQAALGKIEKELPTGETTYH